MLAFSVYIKCIPVYTSQCGTLQKHQTTQQGLHYTLQSSQLRQQ